MKAQEQKVSELTYKFNKRLDVVIEANPNENFVVEDREKSEEMLKNKLYRLRGSNHPLQNQAIKYLQQDILELRAEERNLEIAQGKHLGTLFVSQTPLDNLLAIFEKLAKRKQELQQEQNKKLKNIAEKSLTDANYLFLFVEKTREEVQKFVVDTAKTQNKLTPQPLTAEDYLEISDRWLEEMNKSTSMSKGMSFDEISEKSTHYYQKYEFALQKEQEIIKTQNMESKEPISYQNFTSEIEKMSAEEKRILYLLAKGTQEWEKFQTDSYLNDLEGYIQTIDIGDDSHQKINGLFNSMKAQFSLEQIIDSVSTQIKNNINDIEPDLDKIWEEIQNFSPKEKTYFKLRLDEATSGFIDVSTDDFKQHFGKISNESHSKITEIIQSLSNGIEEVDDIGYLLSQQDKKLYENAEKLLHRIKTDSNFSKEIDPILSKLSEKFHQSKNIENNNTNLSFIDKYFTPITQGYKNFVKELENTPSERFFQDGERQFTEQEKKYLAIYNFKNGIENTPKTITTEKKWEMDNEMEVENTGMSFYMQHEKKQEKMEHLHEQEMETHNLISFIAGGKRFSSANEGHKDLTPSKEELVKEFLNLSEYQKNFVREKGVKTAIDLIEETAETNIPEKRKEEILQDFDVFFQMVAKQENNMGNNIDKAWEEILKFTSEEKTYLREKLLMHIGQNTYSPPIFRELSEISDESVKKVEDFLNKFKEEYFTLLLEKGKIKSDDDDLSIFDDLIDNILVQMEKNDEIRNEINPVYLSMIDKKIQNQVSEKVENLIGIIANNKEDENLGYKTKLFAELSEEEKVFFKESAKDIAIESMAEIQEGISEEEKQTIAQKFDAFFKQIEEKPKKTYEQEEVINYLKNQLMYLGFGQDEKLHHQLEKSVLESENNTKFHLTVPYDKVQEGNHAQFLINFHKSDKGGVYLNSFKGVLVVGETGEERTHSFGANKFTAKEAVNLLEGRAVKAQFTNKFTNELDDVFVQLKLKEEKNEFNNYQMKMFNKNFGIDTKNIVDKSPLIFEGENAEKTKEMVIKSLEKGNIVSVKFKDEANKEMNGKAILNPQYKNINLYDEQMNRVNTNKPIKGLEMDNQQQKNNAREQSIRRTPH